MSQPFYEQLLAALATAPDARFYFWLWSPTRGYLYADLGYPASSASRWWVNETDSTGDRRYDPKSAKAYFAALVRDWPDAVPLLDRIRVSAKRKEKTTETLFCQALCELFGQPVPTAKELPAARAVAQQATVERRAVVVETLRLEGAVSWNSRPEIEQHFFRDLAGADLAGCDLRGVDLSSLDLRGANFAGADLREALLVAALLEGASLRGARLQQAHLAGANCTSVDATGADLSAAKMWSSVWTDACLRDADLTEAIFNDLSMLGTDLTGANLSGIVVTRSTCDGKTRFPAGYVPGPSWVRQGSPVNAALPVEFADFFSRLKLQTDLSRLYKAVAMLKAETFQLFAELTKDAVGGVIRSQSGSGLVYACKLTRTGQYQCGTQNLRPCGGLQGQVCKHLLVLLLGLTRAETLATDTALTWLQLTREQKPAFDQEAMTATFLKYKSVEAGEIDWRPTETVPEDYYAL